MDLIRRIGTQKRKFKLQFFIGRVKFSASFPGKVYIVIRRGNHKVKSQQKLEIPKDCKLDFNKQILELEATLFFDEKQNKYQQKIGQVNVILLDPKQNKALLGIVPFDISEWANSGQQTIKQKKQIQEMPKQLQGLIQYSVFIKYIGEGSQSSMDRVSDFFFRKSKGPQSQKKIIIKEELSNKQIQQEKYSDRGTKKRQKKQNRYSDKVKNKSQTDEKKNDPISSFYLDELQNDKKDRNDKDKPRSNSVFRQNNGEIINKKSRNMKRSEPDQNQYQAQNHEVVQQTNQSEIFLTKKLKGTKGRQSGKRISFQLQNSEQKTVNKSHTQTSKQLQGRLLKSQSLVKQLQKQISQLKSQNQSLNEELRQYKEEIRLKKEEIQKIQFNNFSKASIQTDNHLKQRNQFYQHEIKRIQKQKNQLIVQNSKLKEKYKQDFKKYEQILSQKQEKTLQLNQTGRAELLRIKEQCSALRQTIEKLTKQKSEKTTELNKQKNLTKNLQQQNIQLKTIVSKIKIKICDRLNEALVTNQTSLINILTDLNKF